jgi:hypothetical protein
MNPMAALRDEANSGAQHPFVVFVSKDGRKFNAHAAIARALSDLVRTAERTEVGAAGAGSHEFPVPVSACTLESAVGWMYEQPLGLATLGDAVETLAVATYLLMPKLQNECMEFAKTCLHRDEYGPTGLDGLVSIWLLMCETGIDGPVEIVRAALVKMLMVHCRDDGTFMKNPAIAKLIERTTLGDLARLTSGRRGMCVNLAIEFARAWHDARTDERNEDVLAHTDAWNMPKCFVDELRERSLLNGAERKRKRGTEERPALGFGAWTGRVGDDVCAVELCGQKIVIVAPLRGFPFNCAGKAVHTSQVVQVQGSHLTFPFLRPLGELDHIYYPVAEESEPPAFPTGYVLANGADGAEGWRPFGIVPQFMGDRNSRYAAAAPSHGTLIYFVKTCGTGTDCAVFDVKTCTWTQLPPLLVSRSWPCIAMSAEHLYVIGGGAGQTERLCVTGAACPTNREWQVYGPCAPLTKSAAVFVSPFIYVVGGACSETGAMSSAVSRISTVDGSCAKLPPMIEPRTCPGAFAEEGPGGSLLAIVGGMETYHRRRFVRAEALQLGTADPTWQALEVQSAK